MANLTFLEALNKSLLATKRYVDNSVAGIVDSAPETLDTLKELSTALGDDPNFATTVATNIGKKVDKIEGKTLTANDLTNELKANYDIAYTHSQVVHAPADAQKNSDITKAEIEDKLTGDITTHTHSQYLTEHQSLDDYAPKASPVFTGSISLGRDSRSIVGDLSFAVGNEVVASAPCSHAEGVGTIASSKYQHAQGQYNIKDTADKYAHIVGNGEDDDKRSNAHTLDWKGNAWYAGKISIGTNPTEDMDVTTKKYVDDKMANLNIVKISKTDFEALTTKDANTLYLVLEDS